MRDGWSIKVSGDYYSNREARRAQVRQPRRICSKGRTALLKYSTVVYCTVWQRRKILYCTVPAGERVLYFIVVLVSEGVRAFGSRSPQALFWGLDGFGFLGLGFTVYH